MFVKQVRLVVVLSISLFVTSVAVCQTVRPNATVALEPFQIATLSHALGGIGAPGGLGGEHVDIYVAQVPVARQLAKDVEKAMVAAGMQFTEIADNGLMPNGITVAAHDKDNISVAATNLFIKFVASDIVVNTTFSNKVKTDGVALFIGG